MVRVHAKENESIDKLIQRFKSAVKKSNVLLEVKNREYFLKSNLIYNSDIPLFNGSNFTYALYN